ncbi:Crossover junction endonuclease MUS81 [Folsomia candida]|uniref:Crossover junction endonuclease MUS81 n=1 Tax=Folsomia candida TaxID=158441 RepID=A0A226EQG1_FOLCA|nr:Crossover junction endonuclease MUS81 [Folsomia candida]
MSQSIKSTQWSNVKACANPIFEQWLTEWREDAVQKNSKMQYVYGKAISSLRKYPLLLPNGKACLILEYFGPSIAKMIDRRMQQENMSLDDGSQGFEDLADSQVDPYKKVAKKRQKKDGPSANSSQSQDDDDLDGSQGPAKVTKLQKRGGRTYVPGQRTGPYALLVALGLRESKPGYRGYMTKTELVQESQPHCESSMSRSEVAGGNYTAWNSMSTLVNKGLVRKEGNPTKYLLSTEGRELASKLLQVDFGLKNSDENGSQSSATSNMTKYRTQLEPGQFEIILYVDTSETSGRCKKDEVIGELRKNGVKMEVVRLSVGDFIWVCREIVQAGHSSKRLTISRSAELVLPYVVERKRSDDLAHSIKDGRYHEQKSRLRRTGLQVIYLHEEYGKGQGDFGLAEGALKRAIANTQLVDGFWIQETSNIKDTCSYLTHMTRHFKKMYESKKVSGCTKQEWPTYKGLETPSETYFMTFSDFNDFGTKKRTWKITEMFARHLVRLRGLSISKASAIVKQYPTFAALMSAYEECSSEKEGEMLISGIYFGNTGRTIGPAISRSIYKLYNSPTFPK